MSHKKSRLFPEIREIERMTFLPLDRYGFWASKNGRASFRSPPVVRKVMLEVLKMADFA